VIHNYGELAEGDSLAPPEKCGAYGMVHNFGEESQDL
jgi:hypothetical protein